MTELIAKNGIWLALGALLGVMGWHPWDSWQWWAWFVAFMGLVMARDWAMGSNVQDHRPCAPLAQGPRGSQS